MDGYSVNEAASVLGVPVERVWELLARGVLAGTPEGETGMRVFLQPRQAAAPPPAEAASPTNGGGTEPERELSPFRELLTEFRNLTERYGQALLALGESRGEVASLRSRVDLLEARMDLGLPGPGTQRMPSGWAPGPTPYGFEQTVVPTAPQPGAGAERPAEPEEHRARTRGPRRATESFAEALARAEDPSPPELPSMEAGEGAAPPVRPEPAEPAESILPRELPAAEPVLVAEEAAEPASPPGPEPEAEPVAAGVQAPHVAPEPITRTVETAEPAEGQAEPGQGPPLTDPLEWDADRYTTTIDEPDWFEAEADDFIRAAEAAAAPPSEEIAEAEPSAEPADGEPSVEPARDDPEETLLWLGSDGAPEPGDASPAEGILPGASELDSALEALGAAGGTPASSAAPQDEAPVRDEPEPIQDESDLGAAEPVAAAEPDTAAETEGAEEAENTARPETTAEPEKAAEATETREPAGLRERSLPPAAADRQQGTRPAPSLAFPPSALRYRPVAPPGPTGRAYRRLRRIFPD